MENAKTFNKYEIANNEKYFESGIMMGIAGTVGLGSLGYLYQLGTKGKEKKLNKRLKRAISSDIWLFFCI